MLKKKISISALTVMMILTPLGVVSASGVDEVGEVDGKVKSMNVVKLNAKVYGNLKGDGSDETAAMRNMFKKINKEYSGSMVELTFPEGTYRVTGRVTVYSNLKIIGVPGKTIFKNTSESCKTKAVFTNGEDGRWDYKGNAGSNIEFRDLTFDRCLAISLGHGKNILINRIHVIDSPNAHAIEISSCKDVTVQDSLFEGLDRKNTTESMASRDYNEIIQIDGSQYASYPYFGAYAGGTSSPDNVTKQPESYQPINEDIYIINNVFKASKNNPIPVAIGAHGSWGTLKRGYKNIVIRGNKISDTTNAAIRFPHAESLIVENNEITNTPLGVRYVSTSKVLDTENITIKSNKFKNVKEGILIGAYQTDKRIKNATVTGNTFEGTNAANSVGLKVEYTKALVESNNTFKNFSMNRNIPGEFANVTTNSLNMRKGAGTSYASLGKLSKGTRVEILEKSKNGWTKIFVNNKAGYVSSDYIKVNGASIRKSTVTTTTATKKGVVTGNGLRVRKEANTNSAILTKLYKGDNVTVLNTSKGWAKINYKGTVGYVSSDYLKM